MALGTPVVTPREGGGVPGRTVAVLWRPVCSPGCCGGATSTGRPCARAPRRGARRHRPWPLRPRRLHVGARPIVAGVILAAAALEEITLHPAIRARRLPVDAAGGLALQVGIASACGGRSAPWHANGWSPSGSLAVLLVRAVMVRLLVVVIVVSTCSPRSSSRTVASNTEGSEGRVGSDHRRFPPTGPGRPSTLCRRAAGLATRHGCDPVAGVGGAEGDEPLMNAVRVDRGAGDG